jgi:TonB family protein
MNDLFGSSSMADWILLTVLHSLWISLAAFLIIRFRRLGAPPVKSAMCTFALILLLALPLITWFVPRAVVHPQSIQKASTTATVPIAESKVPLLNGLLDVKIPLPQARINQWKMLTNQFGLLWLAVTLGCSARLFYELAFLKGYRTGLQEVDDERISAVLQEISESFGFRKRPRFYVSPNLNSPVSMGMRIPLVIFPASLYQSIGDVELRAILLHELAHVYHFDHVLGLLQRIIKALYWWNPFVYRLSNTLSVAREEVSDNYAISAMKSATSYATLLVSVIEKTPLISRLPCTAGMATPYESLETRIKNIVSKERDMRVKTNRGMLSAVVVTTFLLVGLVSVGSRVQVFGIGQTSYFEYAKPIVVDIKSTSADFNMELLQGTVLVLEAPDTTRYQSSPILIDGNQGNCEFPDLVRPGRYTLLMSLFGSRSDVTIPSTPHPAVALHMNIGPGRISIYADLILRNEYTDAPQTDPVQLEPSNAPAVLSRIELEYPPDAKPAKLSGFVKVEVVVNEKGEVYEARLLSGHPWFQQPALNAVVQWKFQPLIVNGDAKPFITTVAADFYY